MLSKRNDPVESLEQIHCSLNQIVQKLTTDSTIKNSAGLLYFILEEKIKSLEEENKNYKDLLLFSQSTIKEIEALLIDLEK